MKFYLTVKIVKLWDVLPCLERVVTFASLTASRSLHNFLIFLQELGSKRKEQLFLSYGMLR